MEEAAGGKEKGKLAFTLNNPCPLISSPKKWTQLAAAAKDKYDSEKAQYDARSPEEIAADDAKAAQAASVRTSLCIHSMS